jgi:hypothetical protein
LASYLFVRIVDRWGILERTAGVAGVVKVGAVPAKCPNREIATLRGPLRTAMGMSP